METTRLSTKGQIVLPKSIRTSHAWKPGTEFTVEETREGILLRPANPVTIRETDLDEVAGYLGRVKPLTASRTKAAIKTEVLRRRALGRY